MSKFVTSDSRLRAPAIAWQLAQSFWVGGLWLLHFVVLPALVEIGLAPLLVQEIANGLRPLLVGFSLACVLLQTVSLVMALGLPSLWRDLRGQLLLAVLLLGCGFFCSQAGWLGAYWVMFSYLAMACCGLLLVVQSPPGART